MFQRTPLLSFFRFRLSKKRGVSDLTVKALQFC